VSLDDGVAVVCLAVLRVVCMFVRGLERRKKANQQTNNPTGREPNNSGFLTPCQRSKNMGDYERMVAGASKKFHRALVVSCSSLLLVVVVFRALRFGVVVEDLVCAFAAVMLVDVVLVIAVVTMFVSCSPCRCCCHFSSLLSAVFLKQNCLAQMTYQFRSIHQLSWKLYTFREMMDQLAPEVGRLMYVCVCVGRGF